MSLFRTVLFDLDGTLIDSIGLIIDSYRHTLSVHGLPPRSDEEWLRGIGTPLRTQFADLVEDASIMEELIATYRAYNLAHHDSRVSVYAGVADVVRAVKQAGCATGLVTSKNRHGALRGLTIAELVDAIDILVCADDVTQPKPHREPVDRAVALLGADPATTVYVGDSIHDMQSGRSAGVRTAAVLWGPFTREELAPAAPDYWLSRPEELLTLIRRQTSGRWQ